MDMKKRPANLKYGIWQEKERRTDLLPSAAGIIIAILMGALAGYLIGRF
jgi:hypothetical protein